MSFTHETITRLAHQLAEAERSREQIGHFSLQYPEMTIEDGYAVQRAWNAMKQESGRRPIGRKIGLTSRAMQRASNIEEPDYGLLFDDMLFANNNDIPFDRFIVPRVEVELAFLLKSPLEGPGRTLFDVLDVTDYITPAIEIIDARIVQVDKATGRTRRVFDTISDNAANAGLVLGGRPIRPLDVDLRWISALIHRNGVIEDSGVSAAVLGHPANGPAWLANKLARHGERLEAGDIVLGGSFTAPVAANRGDSFHVDFGTMGSISVRFA
ncbi:MAG: 2-oxo-hepta-3-ene-1,7-dioic acid hydratase [Rhodospirillaceae bacterium]|nr:MAG: 2-oxo-hepta-3-ene-1,7-dioic acid hydratase [Rhodospirillaceae bacterium]